MKHKPDDRSDNVDRIQFNINHTIKNRNWREEMIEKTSDSENEKTI
jgi:small acid-soluble spore protein (thioredoxin-like protein)